MAAHPTTTSILLTAIVATGSAAAQSLCDSFHVPAAHIGNVQNCQFDGTSTTTITFNAPAILRWDKGFNIAANQHLHFAFPDGAGGAVLNRDISGGNSFIFGAVTSNGRVLLVNPSGEIAIQPGGVIDADGGFLASTLDVPDDEVLLAGGGDIEFQGDPFTAINNWGTIRSSSGDVILISGSVNNFGGAQIVAPAGSVRIGAGSRVQLRAAGEPRISVLNGELHTIINHGVIEAANSVELTAFSANPVQPGERDPRIANRGGIIRTTAPGGRIFLSVSPARGQILNAPDGQIEASLISINDDMLIDEGTIVGPVEGSNPAAPTASRQFPRLTTSTLTSTPTSDFRLSRLSFNHLNGLESKTGKKPQKKTKTAAANTTEKKPVAVRGTSKKPAATQKVILRRGTFFGKKTG